ncbi:DUF4304 domain-containing protein [Xanthomonas arboricola]|uniref:DUF4304 domain-containing protein n=1 Tax=Xanthomonas arboricola TaxID=56448 RepID=UPI003183AE92
MFRAHTGLGSKGLGWPWLALHGLTTHSSRTRFAGRLNSGIRAHLRTMNLGIFKKALSKHFYPVLRKAGFRGSGSTLRRVNEPLIYVVNVQGSSGGDRCYLNLGAHLSFLPSASFNKEPDKLPEYECAFRSRILPPEGQAFGWSYGTSEQEAEAIALSVAEAWATQGTAFFERFKAYPESFFKLVANFQPEHVHPADCLLMARIAAHLGEANCAIAIATLGLRRVGEKAVGLRHSINHFIATTNAP